MIHSTCCSMDTTMFDSTEGEPGPVIMKRLRKPRYQTEVDLRTGRPLFLEGCAVPAFDIHRDKRAGHGVEPRRVDDGVEVMLFLRGARTELDAGLRDRLDRLRMQIDEANVFLVECLEVVRVQAGALRTE